MSVGMGEDREDTPEWHSAWYAAMAARAAFRAVPGLRRGGVMRFNLIQTCDWGHGCAFAARLYRRLMGGRHVEGRVLCLYHVAVARRLDASRYEVV